LSGVEAIRSLNTLNVGVRETEILVHLGSHEGLDLLEGGLVESSGGVSLPRGSHRVDLISNLSESDVVLLLMEESLVDLNSGEGHQNGSNQCECLHFL